ncbi:MAG: MotA/TolQ/ExbB proton channel family protein [Pontibacterium sp.]
MASVRFSSASVSSQTRAHCPLCPHAQWQPFLLWFSIASVSAFWIFIAVDQGLLGLILRQDSTRISALLLLLLAVTSLYAGYRAWFLSHAFVQLKQDMASSRTAKFSSLSAPYFRTLLTTNSETTPLSELVGEQVRGAHQVGWFSAGLMIKLGLFGTVAGFILMLGSLDSIDTLDVSRVTELMTEMTQGMKIAMNTTLVGLVSSVLVSVQFLLLDRLADRYLATTLLYGEYLTQQLTPAPMASTSGAI